MKVSCITTLAATSIAEAVGEIREEGDEVDLGKGSLQSSLPQNGHIIIHYSILITLYSMKSKNLINTFRRSTMDTKEIISWRRRR